MERPGGRREEARVQDNAGLTWLGGFGGERGRERRHDVHPERERTESEEPNELHFECLICGVSKYAYSVGVWVKGLQAWKKGLAKERLGSVLGCER